MSPPTKLLIGTTAGLLVLALVIVGLGGVALVRAAPVSPEPLLIAYRVERLEEAVRDIRHDHLWLGGLLVTTLATTLGALLSDRRRRARERP